MSHQFERRALYEEVWATPLIRLCEKYGLSDNGLRRVCKAMNIPLPPAGHWAKLAAGKPVGRIALPRHADRTTFLSRPPPPREHIDSADQAWLRGRLAFEALPEQQITVPASTEIWHNAVLPFRQALNAAIKKRARDIEARDKEAARHQKLGVPNFGAFRYAQLTTGFLSHPKLDGCFRVTERSGERALGIVNALFLASEARGFRVGLGEGGKRLRISLPEATFYLQICERQEGELAFNVSRDVLPDFTLTGDTENRLETQLNRLVCRFYRSIVAGRERTKELDLEAQRRRERERAAEVQRKQMAVEAAQRAAERTRREALLAECARWHESMQIRAYVAHIENCFAGNHPWKEWALRVADERDPTASRVERLGNQSNPSADEQPNTPDRANHS